MKKKLIFPELPGAVVSFAGSPRTSITSGMDKEWARKLPISKPSLFATTTTKAKKGSTLWELALGKLNTEQNLNCSQKPKHYCEITGYRIPEKRVKFT